MQPPHPCQLTQWLRPSYTNPVPGLARGLFVSVGGEPILSGAAEPQTQHGLFVGRKAPLAFGHLWHLGTGMGAQSGIPGSSTLAVKFTHHHHGSNSPTITTGELGEPLSGESGTVLGSVFGAQLVAAVESWGQEPLAVTQPLF